MEKLLHLEKVLETATAMAMEKVMETEMVMELIHLQPEQIVIRAHLLRVVVMQMALLMMELLVINIKGWN